ncbi:MAG: type II toxin-antitoxin system PemK/MazF family toxin [Bacteroidales bacterium]|nr:type II toxin-antitoxin system PemK/MazF family toxin [Bacteroidales bacterium]MCF8337355.1 type II toxin-antitoxin system PemK/MazF family toxin [Bacteroidales bacterium]
MNCNQGDIVTIAFPFSDMSVKKKRPALIISNDKVNNTGDYLMVQITSKIRSDKLSYLLEKSYYLNDKELPMKSCIRLHKIFLLNEKQIISKNTAIKESIVRDIINEIIDLVK